LNTAPALSLPTALPIAAPIDLRSLTPAAAPAFRAIRLEALKYDGRYFAASYQAEAAQPLDAWRALCAETTQRCTLGLFDQTKLVGITAIAPWDEDATGQTALVGSSYIVPPYRGRDLAPALYAERLQWAAATGSYRRAVVFHREGNWPSKHLNERFGGRYWRTQPMQWADGQTAPGLWYRIDLAAFAPR
jgi:RimJ/RimL family protein N-acetyltransferase